MLPSDRRTDAPQLVSDLLAHGMPVATFRHHEPWIDVNHAASIDRAEELILRHHRKFEQWRRPLDGRMCGLLLRAPDGILLARLDGPRSEWQIPMIPLRSKRDSPEAMLSRSLRGRLNPSDLTPLPAFDDLDPSNGKLRRHYVYAGDVEQASREFIFQSNWEWHCSKSVASLAPQSRVLSRSLALLSRLKCAEPVFSR
jgi:hypothetical protein